MTDPYDMLGIDRNADPEQIKSAFRRLAKKYHPDITGGASEKFKRILWAYEQLAGFGRWEKNEDAKTADYDLKININRREMVQDFFDDLKDGVLTLLDIDRQEHLNLFLELTPEQARHGGRIRLHVPLVRKCRKCYGFGKILFSDCKSCGGSGEETYEKVTLLEVPRNVKEGWRAKQHIDNLFLTVIFKIDKRM